MKLNESKYKQVVNYVIEGINEGLLKKETGFLLSMNLERNTIYPEILSLQELAN